MKKNDGAIQFVRNLKSAFGKFKIEDTTLEFYGRKLSKWDMQPAQWDTALDALIRDHPDGGLPSIGIIYDYLKRSQFDAGSHANGGWCVFDLNSRQTVVRTHYENGAWQHIGLPRAATNIRINPDNIVDDPNFEFVGKVEARTAFLQGWLESGAPGEDCMRMWDSLQMQEKIERRKQVDR